MPQKSPLSTLIEIVEKETDEAAKRLGVTIRTHEETEQKLALLTQYREDYIRRFQDSAAQGLSAAQYGNFQAFIAKLDGAVEGQKQVVKDAKYRIQIAREFWQENEKKRLSYNTLHNRAEATQQRKEAKQDQKQTDEHAARAFFYKS